LLLRLLTTPIINVQVGTEEPKLFSIHQGLLSAHSRFFRGLLRHDFSEMEEGVVKLPKDDVKTFAMFAQWLYTGESGSGEIAASETELSDLEIGLPCKIGDPFSNADSKTMELNQESETTA
jgi:hypothetical protein